MRKKGFTLIELIVVMAIIAILVLLGVPKYKEYTKEAHLTKIKVNVKELETASQKYYMVHNDWPRLKDEPYTAEQIDAFTEEIRNKTGAVVILESDGKYYDIDYAKLNNYLKKSNDSISYILQNPVGNIYYLEGITQEGKERIPDGDDSNVEPEIPEEPETPEDPEISVEFSGLSPAAFDKDSSTSGGLGTVTWEGNLANKRVTIDILGLANFFQDDIHLHVYDSNNAVMKFINLTNSTEVDNITTGSTRIQKDILVPEGAVKFVVSGRGLVYDIYTADSLESPKTVNNITHTSNDSSITLNWSQDDINYEKAAIYRDGVFLTVASGKTYIDKPLYSETTHVYEIQAINSYGNASNKVSYTASTTTPEIIFMGLKPAAFDGDSSTSGGLGTVTWEGNLSNKKVVLDIKGGQYNDQKIVFKIYDSNNIAMNFVNLTNSSEVDNITTGNTKIQREIIVPEGAVKFVLSGYGGAFEISVSENLESPTPVYNVTSISTDSSIILNWEQADSNYAKTAIYKDGALLAITTSKTYIDKPLYSASSHTYEIQAINSYGNASSEKISYTASTTIPEIIFRGLKPAAFDKDNTTAGGIGTVTWEGNLSNKKIVLVLKGGQYNDQPVKFSIYDINNNVMNFMNLTNGIEVNVISVGKDKLQKEIIVPDEAVKFVLSGYGGAYDIYMSDSL